MHPNLNSVFAKDGGCLLIVNANSALKLKIIDIIDRENVLG